MKAPTSRSIRLLAAAAVVLAACGETGTTTPGGQDSVALSFTSGFSTYLGGSGIESIRDVVADAQGNVYVTGATQSGNFPATAGVFGANFHSSGSMLSDAFVTKYDASGHVLWSTFLGGPEYDRAYAIEVDELGFVYVAGRAGAGFPVTPGALQTAFAGGTQPDGAYGPQDGFVCKLKPDGSGVVFCTYFGNSSWEAIRDIAIDASHNIYIASGSFAGDPFPSAWFANAYQKTVRGGRDGLIVKLRSDGSAVDWATYLGGSQDEDNGNSVRVDGSGVYVVNTTHSTDMPTPNGFDHSLSGASDLYVAKLSLDGSQLLFGTYVGGSGGEVAETHHIAVDAQGNAIVASGSTSTDFPTTPTAFQRSPVGAEDVLVVKISPTGALVAATYVGGSGNEFAEGVAVDPAGNFYFAGGSTSSDFPVTGGQGGGGVSDAIFAVLSPDLSHLLFSRRFGGNGDDTGRSVAVSTTTAVVGGQSNSPNWPLSAAAQAGLGGSYDGVIARFIRQQ